MPIRDDLVLTRAARARTLCALVALASFVASSAAEPVRVRHREGLVHGFLALSTVEGKTIADGDLFQRAEGDRVTSRLVFRFRDGSTFDERSVFTQKRHFRLLHNHSLQKGPSFPREIESTIDVGKGRTTVRVRDKDGTEETISDKRALPQDLANGLILTLLKNISPDTPKTTVPMLAITPRPRLVNLEFTPDGRDSFSTGGAGREATRYRVRVDIPGLMGVMADVIDKEPPDSYVWVLGGDAPAFIMSLAPMYMEGPLWRIELVSPTWPKSSPIVPGPKDD